jgi:acyl-CoA reductase-like NAD-dependent aldehyde dehydrogenase
MSSLRLLIDGRLVDGDQSMNIINPATGSAFASCPRASVKQLHDCRRRQIRVSHLES